MFHRVIRCAALLLAALILAPVTTAAQQASRLVAVGDLHGDYDAWMAIAQAAHLADDRTSFEVVDQPSRALGYFDVVVCNEVLYGVPDPEGMLDDIHGLLPAGGNLLTSIWRHPTDVGLRRMLDARFELVDAVSARNLTDETGDHGWRVSWYRRS